MNRTAIELSNHGIAELQKGNAVAAFDALAKAANITMMLVHNHKHSLDGSQSFQFHWIDCAETSSEPRKEGCVPFLFRRGLRISTNCNDESVDALCPCGFAWAIWFNLALCCSVLGSQLGEKGLQFLEMAHELYLKVQRRVDSEPVSRHWHILTMAISNNQACIFHELSMQQATLECLQRLAQALSSCREIEVGDRGDFCLNLQILGSQTSAAAA